MSGIEIDSVDAPVRPLIVMADAQVRAEPGQYTVTSAEIRNPSAIVETYDLRVLGPAGAWVEVSPTFVSLFPGESDSVTITLQPPQSSRIVAGTYAVGLQATSQVRPESTASSEVIVQVPAFYRFRCVVSQNSFTVRTKTTMRVQVANEGNSTVTYAITAEDPDGYLNVEPRQPTISLAPGESRWIEVLARVAPKLVGSAFDTRSFLVTVQPVHDDDLDLPILDVDPEVATGGLTQRPYIRLRLGVLGRLIILLTLLGLIAAFFLARWAANNRPASEQGPPVPAEFSATLGTTDSDIILTWAASPGATGYTIYAVGATGDPAPTPTPVPTIIVQMPGGGAVGQAAPWAAAADIAAKGVVSEDDTAADAVVIASPVCEDCSAVAQVVSGVTRYVVEGVQPGEACYRIAATEGQVQSLFSIPACTVVPDPALRDEDGNGVPDAQDQAAAEAEAAAAAAAAAELRPCPPVQVSARPSSSSSVAILWRRATEPPKGYRAPEGDEIPAVRARENVPLMEPEESKPVLLRDRGLRGGGGKGDSSGSAGGGRVCDPTQEPTGWVLQRRIFTGWSNVDPAPAAGDTAFEVTGLEPATQYCFRLRAQGPERASRYSPRFCATTDAEPILVPVPVTPQGPAPTTTTPAPASQPGTIIIDDLPM